MQHATKVTLKVVITSIALITSSLAFAESEQEAINLNNKMKQACSDKDEGDVCDFTNDKGESINGQCKRSGSTSDSSLQCIATN